MVGAGKPKQVENQLLRPAQLTNLHVCGTPNNSTGLFSIVSL